MSSDVNWNQDGITDADYEKYSVEISRRAKSIGGFIRTQATLLYLSNAAEKYCNENMIYDQSTRDLILHFANSLLESDDTRRDGAGQAEVWRVS